jgi:hypothetical protein
LDFLRHIHERDVRIGRTKDFLPDQLKVTLFGFPLTIAGLYFCLISRAGRGFRMLGWMYLVPLLLFVIAKGRGYYLAGAYPMLCRRRRLGGSGWSLSVESGQASCAPCLGASPPTSSSSASSILRPSSLSTLEFCQQDQR